MGILEDELARRLDLWDQLKQLGNPEEISASVIQNLGIYKGSRGVYFDSAQTRQVNGVGVVVSLKTSGRNYKDVMTDDEAIYDFPETQVASRDEVEIKSIEAAELLNLPIFFISENPNGTRKVRLSYIIGSDRAAKCCVVQFGSNNHKQLIKPKLDSEFSLNQHRRLTEESIKRLERDPKFKFNALARYSARCALTDISVRPMLDAAHVVPVAKGGNDDPRNSLVLSASTHRAFDSHLWAIKPETLQIVTKEDGPTLQDMRITQSSIEHLSELPHPTALEARWELFMSSINGRYRSHR